MPDPLPESGQISIFQIAEFYEGGSENLSLQSLASNLEPEPEANIAMSLFYSSSSCTSFSWSSEGVEEPEEACEFSTNQTAYHNGSGTYPVASDTVYTDSSCTTPAEAGVKVVDVVLTSINGPLVKSTSVNVQAV